jgi:hypothetical protein
MKTFSTAKEEYENKTKYADNSEALITEETTYKIEFLWTTLGEYATEENIVLTLEVKAGTASGIYDLGFNLSGSYDGIRQFLYSLENDERLNFKIDNFELLPGGAVSTANTQTTDGGSEQTQAPAQTSEPTGDTVTLQATFEVTGVSITLE